MKYYPSREASKILGVCHVGYVTCCKSTVDCRHRI